MMTPISLVLTECAKLFSWRRDLRYNCAYCTEEKKMRNKPFFVVIVEMILQ